MATKTFSTNITQVFTSADGDKSISVNELGLTLTRNILTTPVETIITPLDITDVNTGNSITMDRLTYLPIGLGALTIPTIGGTTCNLNDAIQLQDYNNTPSPPPTHSEVKIGSNPSTLFGFQINSNVTPTPPTFTMSSDTPLTLSTTGYDLTLNGGGGSQVVITSADNTNITAGVGLLVNANDYISMTVNNGDMTLNATNGQVVNNVTGFTVNASDYIQMTANNDFIQFTADDNISLVSNGLGDIRLEAPNINSYGYAMPICFDFVEIDRTYNYTSGGQNYEIIFTQNLNVPSQFFVDSPQVGYTSNIWRIDFTINTWNGGGQNNTSDKGLAFYIDFQDQSTTYYTPTIFRNQKPFCRHSNNSTWTGGGGLSEFQPYTWTDYIDFTALGGTGNGNLPLKLNIYFAADNPKQFDFTYKLGLTRTNIIPP